MRVECELFIRMFFLRCVKKADEERIDLCL